MSNNPAIKLQVKDPVRAQDKKDSFAAKQSKQYSLLQYLPAWSQTIIGKDLERKSLGTTVIGFLS